MLGQNLSPPEKVNPEQNKWLPGGRTEVGPEEWEHLSKWSRKEEEFLVRAQQGQTNGEE